MEHVFLANSVSFLPLHGADFSALQIQGCSHPQAANRSINQSYHCLRFLTIGLWVELRFLRSCLTLWVALQRGWYDFPIRK